MLLLTFFSAVSRIFLFKTNFNHLKSMSLDDYDCIGFDLDNTLLEYDVLAMNELIYNILSNFLVRQKSYSGEKLLQPMAEDVIFLQRGLAMDFQRGNIVKLGVGGKIIKACHGTKLMSSEEVADKYGANKIWDVGNEYISDILSAWNGPLSEQIRCVLDYFDVCSTLVFARAVDTVDQNGIKTWSYVQVWRDILDGLTYMYSYDNFARNEGEYFPALKNETDKYIRKTHDSVLQLLRTMRTQGKFIFLLTGSAVDFASFTSSRAMGASWQDLFDLVVCYARKPGFFTGDRPFLTIEGEACSLDSAGKIVTQGNWTVLKEYLGTKTGLATPRVLYVGDNIVQDVLAARGCCEALAVCQEIIPSQEPIIGASSIWGSYLKNHDGTDSFWQALISKYAVVTVPSVRNLAR